MGGASLSGKEKINVFAFLEGSENFPGYFRAFAGTGLIVYQFNCHTFKRKEKT
jgi:hypothetical protein